MPLILVAYFMNLQQLILLKLFDYQSLSTEQLLIKCAVDSQKPKAQILADNLNKLLAKKLIVKLGEKYKLNIKIN